MKLYTIYDEKAESYGNPFSALNDKVAIRIFEDASNDPSTQIHHHKEDFILYGLANYNEDTAEITVLDKKQYLIKAIAFAPEITD